MEPVLLTVDDDTQVLKAIERDLNKNYGNRFRIPVADSANKGLELTKQLKLQNGLVVFCYYIL
jgi:thioredoxin reductase (NADPH)